MSKATITITIDENGIECQTDLGPIELVYWLELAKKVVIEDSLAPATSEVE